ncbi:MAG: T9SS type A sorting domain-containing protein [Bacteroidetes bacterium]|nr:T9SS type A sorting domain-containing protein [Bacteroidota bacterium]
MKSFLTTVAKTVLVITLFLVTTISIAQTSNNGWKAKFETQKVFIENKGQFNHFNSEAKSPILYGTEYANAQFLFTKTGLTYRLTKKEFPSAEEKGERENDMLQELRKGKTMSHDEMEEEENRVETRIEKVTMRWVNANPQVEIEAIDAVENYFNFGLGNTSINEVKGYKKLVYKNLYPKIDVVYVFHPDNGIEYSFILHPGADASQIKMNYAGAEKITMDAKNNIHLKTDLGDIVDHAPQSFYSANNQQKISSQFIRNGNVVSFVLGNYNHHQEITIDPWTVTPNFPTTQWDCVWECEKDAAGNAYLIGGTSPMQLLKYNAAGALQWTYNTPYDTTSWLGTFAVDNAGNSYVTQGSIAAIQKISPAGAMIWSNPNPGGIFASTEFWSISFNCDQTKLVIGGTGNTLPPQPYVYQVDMSNGNVTANIRVTDGALFPTEEVRSITACGNGKYYFMTHDSIGYLNQNFSLCGTPAQAKQYFDNTYHLGYKCENFRYNNTGIEAIKTYGGFVYVNRGNRLDKRNFTTGAIIASVAIPGGAFTTQFGSSFNENSGIDIDDCGNIYVGSKGQVVKYNQSLTQLATYPATTNGSTIYNVYDVEVSTGGNIIVAGSTGTSGSGARTGAMQQIAVGACGIVAITCCDASVCQMGPYCTTDGAVTLTASTPGGTWSGVGITNTSTGVFNPTTAGQGTHYIVNTIGCGSDSIAITVNICASLSACLEQNGNITATGGAGPYTWYEQDTTQDCSACLLGICNFPPGCSPATYTWNQFASGNTEAVPEYPVRIVDINNNQLIITSTTVLPNCTACSITASASTTGTTCGSSNGSATVNPSGATPTGYNWSNGATTATASNLAAGNYTVTVTASGCSVTAAATVASSTGITVNATTTNAGCTATGSATANVTAGTGPFTYTWTGGANTQTASNLSAGNYTVTVSGAGNCTATATAIVGASGSGVGLSSSATPASCGNSNGTASVTTTSGTGPFTYLWSTGGTTSSLLNLASATYTVTVTGSGNCTATASINVSSTAGVSLTTSGTNTGCTSTGSVTATVTAGTGPYTYIWSNGATTQTASNLAAGTYNVTVTGAGNCTATATMSIISSGGITLTPTFVNTSCGNNNGSASVTATGGSGTYTYSWSGGGSGSSLSNLAAGTYTVTVNDNVGCSSTASMIISPSGNGSVHITAANPIMCAGDSIQVCADNTYNSYLWNNGATTQCIYAHQAGNYYVTVTDAGSCTASSNHVPVQVYPLPPVSISVNGDTLTAYNAVTYQWYLNGGAINGATNHIYIVTQNGTYTLAITDTNGCRVSSNPILINTVGIASLFEGEQLKVYPNPLENGNWTLETGVNAIGSKVEIFDDNGRLVYRADIANAKSEIELKVASGVYMMRVSSAKHEITLKLIKL